MCSNHAITISSAGAAVAVPEEVITEAVARYEREHDRYLKLAARVADICRTDIIEADAIRAQVTSRVKTSRSLEGKLRRFARRGDKNISTVEEVFSQIGDLAGVRIATYRPEDQNRVANKIKLIFPGPSGSEIELDKKDKLSEGGFYRATHCQAALPDSEIVGINENLRGTSCEIQICSMMAHVFNEVEHDIAYKPEGGGPQSAEKGLIDALGHLARTGDSIVSQLLAANEMRLKEQAGDFNDAFDFVARLRKEFKDRDLSGYAGQLFDEICHLGLNSLDKLKKDVGDDHFNSATADEIISNFNRYMEEKDDRDFLLDNRSSDLVLAILLQKHASTIVQNHPAGRGMGRPPRIRSIAMRFLDFTSPHNPPETEGDENHQIS